MTTSHRASDRAFLAAAALLFVASAAATVVWCSSMSSMGSPWMLMPGRSLLGATASFTAQWLVMMVAMMMPSLVPELMHYRHALRAARNAEMGALTALVAVGYFLVWAAAGAAIFMIGAGLVLPLVSEPALAQFALPARGVVGLAAVARQIARGRTQTAVCRPAGPALLDPVSPTAATAWRYGIRLGLRCLWSSAEWTACLLVFGVMDLRVMLVVTVIVTVTRRPMPRFPAGTNSSAMTGRATGLDVRYSAPTRPPT